MFRRQPFVAFIALLFVATPAWAIDSVAKQAFLIDMQTHDVMLNKDADTPMHPSSMSKLMTTYILFKQLKDGKLHPEDKLPVSEKAWRMQGSKTFVHVGDEVPVEALMHGIITQSGNDACVVVAEAIAGSEEAFAEMMNAEAKELGLAHSHFVNATGWPDDNHLMSARDLATLAERLIVDFPEYYDAFSLPSYRYNNINQQNRNRLLGKSGVDGLKTGHTDAGGYGIVLSAKENGRRVILVINGLASDDDRVKEGERLINAAFREFENKTLVHAGEKIADAEVWFGKQPTVALAAKEDLAITLPVAAQEGMKLTLRYDGPLPAPIAKGDEVATLHIEIPGGESRDVKLVAAEPVAKISGPARILAVLDYYLFGRK